MTTLIDTNAILAHAFANDTNHSAARRQFDALAGEQRILVQPALTELFYMVSIRSTYSNAMRLYQQTRAAFHIEPLTDDDLQKIGDLMKRYQDAELDFVDMSIMAVAERLKISRIFTFDRRDFSLVRPDFCESYELLPLG